MARHATRRRTLSLECLENRALLSSGGPSAQEEYMIQLLNEARTQPAAAAERATSNLTADDTATVNYYNVDLNAVKQKIAAATPQPALAWNPELEQAATAHSQDMAVNGFQSHNGSDGSNLGDRLGRVNYPTGGPATENAFAYATSIDQAMKAFMLDWGVADDGHRLNIQEPGTASTDARREVGIGIVGSSKPGYGPLVITQDFASRPGAKADLLGAAFNDLNGDNFYQPGEGQGGVEIDATNKATGKTTSTQTWDDSGAYQMELDPGDYTVAASLNGKTIRIQDVTVGSTNIQVNYNLSQPWQTQSPAPAPAPSAPAAPANNAPLQVAPPPNASGQNDPAWSSSWTMYPSSQS